MHVLTDYDEFPPPAEVPDDGDPDFAASVNNEFQVLQNRTTWNKNRVNDLTSRIGGPGSQSGIWYAIPMRAWDPDGVDDWRFVTIEEVGESSIPVRAITTAPTVTPTVARRVVVPISPYLPRAGYLWEIEWDVIGSAADTYAGLPQHMPAAKLTNFDLIANDYSVIRSIADASGVVGDYIVMHNMGTTELSDTAGSYPTVNLAESNNLQVIIWSEYGENAQNETRYLRMRCKVARSTWGTV